MKFSASTILILLLAASETATAIPRRRRTTRIPTTLIGSNGNPTPTVTTVVSEADEISTTLTGGDGAPTPTITTVESAVEETATSTGGEASVPPVETESIDIEAGRGSSTRGGTPTRASSSSRASASPTNGGGGGGNGALALDPANVQDASSRTGQEAGDNPAQADSLTDSANFINFCKGKTLTNGQQVKGGSCNGIVMGDIPSTANMISTIITFPSPGDTIAPDTEFTVKVTVANLVAGSFTNPANTYYAAPQTLQGGKVVGHTHITIQVLDSLKTKKVPDAASFIFFKGINDNGDGNGNLEAAVTGGLPAGVYRLCTMSSASNHQPVLMPIAQRGAQDDCTKFVVGGGGGN